jgi:hypothetical protein
MLHRIEDDVFRAESDDGQGQLMDVAVTIICARYKLDQHEQMHRYVRFVMCE